MLWLFWRDLLEDRIHVDALALANRLDEIEDDKRRNGQAESS